MPPPGAKVKASFEPSGDQATEPTGSSRAVTASGQPASAATVQTWGTPLRSETNARRRPSGEKLGDEHDPTLAIRATIAPASSASAPAGDDAKIMTPSHVS